MRLLAIEKKTSIAFSRICDDRALVIQTDSTENGLSILRHETLDLVLVDITSLHEDGSAFV
jgi:response regulator RpfG family c-di-GMP phosphodiesterase